jgi:hypothetical protein
MKIMTSYDILSDVKHPTHKMFIIHEFVWEVSPHNPMGLYRWTRMKISRLSSRFGRPNTWGNFQGNSRPKIASKARLEAVRIWVSGIAFGFAIVLSPCAQVTWDYPQPSTPIFTRSPGSWFGFGGYTFCLVSLVGRPGGVTYSYIDQCQ